MFVYKVVVWVKKGLKHAYVIYEWSLRSILVYLGVAMTKKCNSCPKWWEMSLLKLLPLYWNKYNSNSMTYAWAVMYSSTKLISTCYLCTSFDRIVKPQIIDFVALQTPRIKKDTWPGQDWSNCLWVKNGDNVVTVCLKVNNQPILNFWNVSYAQCSLISIQFLKSISYP